MADEHIGALVLIDCGAGLGTYQGRIASVDPSSQTITLEQPLRNGVPYQVPKVTLKSEDIADLKILQLAAEFEQAVSHVLTSFRGTVNTPDMNGVSNDVSKLNAGRGVQFGNGHLPTEYGDQPSAAHQSKPNIAAKLQQRFHVSPGDLLRTNDERKKSTKAVSPKTQRPRSRPNDEHRSYERAHEKDDSGRRTQPFDGNGSRHRPLSDLCAPLDFDLMSTDFDFESNLAMFEKLPRHPETAGAALNSSAKQTAALDRLFHSLDTNSTKVLSAGSPTQSKNIRHDENVVHDPSRVYVNAKRTWRYLTEDGIDVPAITAAQKRELYDRALRKGYVTQDGFVCAVANSAAHLSLQILREKNIASESVQFYMIFSAVDAVSKQTAKHLSRFFVNRGQAVTWISTDASAQPEHEFGVKMGTNLLHVPDSPHSPRSFVFVIGRQGPLADKASAWLLKNSFYACMFVESDWRGVETAVSDEDLLTRLGLDGGTLIRLPSRISLCWQLPCEDMDADLKSPVFICDINLPSHFVENELPALATLKDARQKSKPYKFPFGQGGVVKLRKL